VEIQPGLEDSLNSMNSFAPDDQDQAQEVQSQNNASLVLVVAEHPEKAAECVASFTPQLKQLFSVAFPLHKQGAWWDLIPPSSSKLLLC
jgi:hypothetical protein